MADTAKLVSVQCRQEDKDVFSRARAIYGSLPNVMEVAARGIEALIAGQQTVEDRRKADGDALAQVSNVSSTSTKVRQTSNGHTTSSNTAQASA